MLQAALSDVPPCHPRTCRPCTLVQTGILYPYSLQANGPAAGAPTPPYAVSAGYGPHSLPAYAHQAPPPAPPPAHTLSTAVDLMNTGKVPRTLFSLHSLV